MRASGGRRHSSSVWGNQTQQTAPSSRRQSEALHRLFVGMIMGSTAMLMAASAVLLRGVGMLLSSIVPSHFMMVRGLAMVMGGSFMVSRSVVVVFNG